MNWVKRGLQLKVMMLSFTAAQKFELPWKESVHNVGIKSEIWYAATSPITEHHVQRYIPAGFELTMPFLQSKESIFWVSPDFNFVDELKWITTKMFQVYESAISITKIKVVLEHVQLFYSCNTAQRGHRIMINIVASLASL